MKLIEKKRCAICGGPLENTPAEIEYFGKNNGVGHLLCLDSTVSPNLFTITKKGRDLFGRVLPQYQ